jgi:glycosyltransferase involved in cell wall biosynthesis
VVCAYNSRHRIDTPLRSLQQQDTADPFEVVVVASGDDGCAEYTAEAFPGVRVIHSEARLYPAEGRNRGVGAARGRYVAFIPDDCAAPRDWLRRRLDKHREGFAAVGGSITNGTPRSPVGSAGYYLEYSDLLPSERVLARQWVPHSLSYERELVLRLGGFPEDVQTGEDTVLNQRLLREGTRVGYDARIQLAHDNPTGLRRYLAHQHDHGRGLVTCADRHGLTWGLGKLDVPAPVAAYRAFGRFPLGRWLTSLASVARGRPSRLPYFVALTPLLWAGLWAASAGAWTEWRVLRGRG